MPDAVRVIKNAKMDNTDDEIDSKLDMTTPTTKKKHQYTFIRSQQKLRKLDISYKKSFKGVILALKSQENSLQELILSGQYIPKYKKIANVKS
ncbi:hypothetical protein C2G38_2161438 [Gigaspora rosea]|uniref:Uncharacterized protein n=1 Tax=Gigaspora rosea TaxID=44941 RepID=A0A397VX04_9GLOM|nr:hypothetical protein C2G38_2161438 [Gigaspora rosea]